MANSTFPEDGQVYFITNKVHHHARIAQWGTNGRDMGTYEGKVYPDQMWVLKEDKVDKGWFLIENAYRTGYRIAKWGCADSQTGIYNGPHYPDQLWKFVPAGNGYYYIYNKVHCEDRLAKWGKGNSDWGSYGGPKYDDQLWCFTPRFEAEIDWVTLWEADNRQGSQEFSEKVTITTGLKLTQSSSFTTKTSLTTSLEAALCLFSAKVEMNVEIENTVSTGSEQSWSVEREITFTAPPGKIYRVRQPQVVFKSMLHDDDCVFTGNYKIEESTQDFQD